MTRRVSLHYWEGPFALIRTLGAQKLQTRGNRRNYGCIKAGSHVTSNNPKFYFEIRFPNPPLIWFHSDKTAEAVLQLVMRLCDDVKAVPDSRPFPEFHIPGTDTLQRATQTVSRWAACISIYDSFLFCTAENLSSAVSGNEGLK